MARKKTITTVEEETPEVDYSEIQDNPLEAIVSGKDEETPKEQPKVEEKKPLEEEEVPFDPEAYKKEVLAEAAALIEKTTGTKEKKDEVDQELVSPWAKENRTPKDYEEIADWAVKKKDILDNRHHEEEVKNQQEAAKQTEEANKAQIDNFNKYTDEQLDDLFAAGKLDKNNPEERKALFQAMLDVNLSRQKEGKPAIYSIKEIYYEHFDKSKINAQPAGADAPVSAGRGAPTGESKEINYVKDIQPGRNFTNWLTDVFSKKN